ncbi:LINGO2 [Branchiostoma lanceolatum]|uniref:LINGO2 protein n=1 Tax=Branchiostoma lanceolatum TaxID=7740 RepID=A0A8K0ER41_BRALA|nr:LINGO2 [Branchiostoma lanceolatum]
MERVTFVNIALLGLFVLVVPSGGGCHGKEFPFASSETTAPQNEHPLRKSGGQLQGDSLLKVDKPLIKEEEIAQNKAASRILHLKALAPNKMSIERWKRSGSRHLQLPGNGPVRVLDLIVQTETTLRISCDVTGSSQPSMVWYLPSRENITAGSNGSDVRMSVEHDGVLQIRDFSMADTGLFICADTIVPDCVYVVAQVDAYSVKIILAVAAGFVVFSMLAGSCVLCKYLQYKKSMALIPEEERRKPKSFDSW